MAVAESTEMKWHPAACIFPMMSDEELIALSEDIKQHGQREPIVIFEGKVLDGRNRWIACRMAGVEPVVESFFGSKRDALAFVWSVGAMRAERTSGVKAAAYVELEKLDADYVAAIDAERAKAASRKGGDRKSERQIIDTPKSDADKNADRVDAKIADAIGTNRTYLNDARKIYDKRPDLHEKIKQGELTIPQAKAEIKREEKRQEIAEAVKLVEQFESETPLWTLIQKDDVTEGLAAVRDEWGPVRLIFTDPPYNIGIDYGRGKEADLRASNEYIGWVSQWISLCKDCLSEDGSLWVMIGDEYAAEYGLILKNVGFTIRNWIKWYETFGVNCSNRFNRTSRHIFYCVVDPDNFVFNPDAVTRPSDRQQIYGDKRASSGGKLWDDVWEIPRLTGTCKERIPDFPTQLPLALVRPIVECASMPGDLVLDPFNGSGTTGVAAIETKRKYVGIEQLEKNVDIANLRLTAAQFGGTK